MENRQFQSGDGSTSYGDEAIGDFKTHVARAKLAGTFYDMVDAESNKTLEVIAGSVWEDPERHDHYLGFRKYGNRDETPMVLIRFNCVTYHAFVDDLRAEDGLAMEPNDAILMAMLSDLFRTDNPGPSSN